MSITDELREGGIYRPSTNTRVFFEEELLAIADRIDAEHRAALEKVSAMVDEPDSSCYFDSYLDRIIAANSMPARIDAFEKRLEAIERKLNHKGGAE